MSAFTCPWCGQTEPNDMLLRNNHWVKWGPLDRFEYDWCREHGMCVGQQLVLNHLWHDLNRSTPAEQLRRTLARAQQKWQARDDQPPILAEARVRLAQIDRAARPPEPHAVPVTEQGALL